MLESLNWIKREHSNKKIENIDNGSISLAQTQSNFGMKDSMSHTQFRQTGLGENMFKKVNFGNQDTKMDHE